MPQRGEPRVAGVLRPGAEREEHDEDGRHGREHRPALAGVAHHDAEGVTERGGDHEDREDLEEVAERRRVLERMRRVDVEEAAAVGAELLDRDLRGRRPHGQRLLGDRRAVGVGRGLDEGHRLIRFEVLHHALRDQRERQHERQGQQDVERAAREVHPEVADVRAGAIPEAPEQRHEDRHPAGRRDEVLHRQRSHLGEVAHGGLATVALPVGVGREAHRRVERRVRRDRPQPLRVEWQDPLRALQQVHDQQAEKVEHHHRDGVRLPGHSDGRIDTAHAIGEPLDRPEDPRDPRRLAVIDARHERAEGFREREEDDEVEDELQESVRWHQKISGLSMATRR